MVEITNKKYNNINITVSSSGKNGMFTPNNNSTNYYSSLAKDWACKTNNTVDGNEYSSKYYAQISRECGQKLLNDQNIKIVGEDLRQENNIKICADNMDNIKSASTNANTAKEQANIATQKANEILSTSNNKANIDLDNISTNGKKVIQDNSRSGMPVGTIFSHSASNKFVPENSLPCDGTEYTKAQFPSLYTDWLANGNLLTCTYEEYQQDITTNGACAKFALDTANSKFKIPFIPDGYYVKAGKGTANKAGLPNIEGYIDLVVPAEGAFSPAEKSTNPYTLSPRVSGLGTNLDASKSNPIYGASNTVETNAVTYRYFVVVATDSIKQSEMDWSQWASGLEGKANTDLSNCTKPYIVESYVNGLSGYNIYSNGYCEQWGMATGGNTYNGAQITFLKPFKDTNFSVVCTMVGTTNGHPFCHINERTSPKFFTLVTGHSFTTFYPYASNWVAKGYVK